MASGSNSSFHYVSQYSSVESAFLVFTLVLIILVSLAGGIVMLYVLYSNDKMWTSTNMLIGNLALISTCLALFVMPFHLFTAGKREWIFGESGVCKFTGFSASLLLLATIFTHMIISIDKYFAVVKPMSRFMTAKKTGLLIAIVWATASVMSIIPLAGVSRFEYNPTTLICGVGFPKQRLDLLYLLLLAGLGFVVPLHFMGFAYIRVYVAVRKHSARLLAHSVSSTDVLSLQRRLILTVFASLVCFLICWSTFFALTVTAVLIKDKDQLPRGLGVAAYWTGYLNSALNPLVICSLSNRFKEGFLSIFSSVKALLSLSCQRQSEHFDKRRAETKSTFVDVVFFESATLQRYSKKNSRGSIDASELNLQTIRLCKHSSTDQEKECSNSGSDHSRCLCAVGFSDV